MSATLVLRDDELDGLGQIVADLLEANLADGSRSGSLGSSRWRTTIFVRDADSTFLLEFGAGEAAVKAGSSRPAELRIEVDGDTLVQIPEVPLVLGLPDPRTPEGRELLGKLLRRDLRIGGLLRHPFLLRRLLMLLTTTV